MNSALQRIHHFGLDLHQDQSMQRFLQQCKFIGVGMYQLALQVEILGGLLGDSALFRQNIGTIDRQDRKIQEWPVSQASDTARMINFLRASFKRADIQDKKRVERKKKAPVIDVSQGKSSASNITCRHQNGVKHCLTSTNFNLEAFRCHPADGSFAALAFQLTAFTNYLNEVFLSY